MGLSSSLLDENKFNFIKGWTQTELRNFASFYKKQYSLAFLSHVHDELVQRKQEHTQLLKQRDPPQEAEVIYQESVLYFYDNRKWKERFLVVRANYSLECHESYETFMKGILPPDKLPTTGGTILTTEEKYMEVVDRCFPDTDNVKEDFAPPVVGMPGQFPVYLRLPYQRDHYFCFLQEAKQAKFISVLSDCIRHQNQDFLKKKTYEVQAFAKAVQLYRQDKGYYEPWDMLIGNDVQVLANLTMEELLPSLEKDLLPRLKAKKMERKRMWFATIEATYNLVQETLMEDMAALNDECRETTKQQSALMRSDMDQIMSSQAFLESKLRATVADLATEYCKQHIEPHLRAVLEEMMGPISLGFEEAREVSESMMEYLCQKYQEGMTREELQQALVEMSKPNLESCYEKVSGLRDHIQEFNYPNCRGLEHSTQIDIQQLVDSVAYTYGLLLSKSPQDSTNLLDAMVKARNRVLKQYDYDSSTQRKKIFQEALLSITLPSVKAFLAPTFKKELPNFEQYIFDDYVNFINVENVYEDILQQILETDISKVVKEAASMKKYNLFMESRYRFSVSSMYVTPPGSPDYTSTLTKACNALPSSPLLSHGLMESQSTGEDPIVAKKKSEPEVIMAQQEEVQAQPELTNVPTGENTFVAEKMVEQEVIIAQQGEVQARTQPDLIKVPAGEDTVMAEKMVEPEVIVAQKVEVQAHTQLDLIKEPTGEDTVMGEKIVEQEEIMAQQVQLPAQAQPELTKVPTGEDPVMAEKMVEPEVIVAQQVEVQAHAQPELIARGNEVLEVPANAATEVRDRFTTPETLTVHTAGVEEMLVATQSLEESTYSGPPNVVAINTETLVDPSSSSNTEPTLKSAALTLAEPIPKPVETEANETPVQASPPEGDTGSMDQVSKSETSSSLKFVSAESETESAANIRISSAEETVPGVPSSSGVQPLVVEEQNSNTTGDTKVVVDDLTSLGAPIYEIRASNMAQDFSDDSSWTTEEEGDSIEEDDLTTETTSAIPEPEDSVIVKCETISDVSMNVNNNSADPSTEAARPLDCIKEIRALVVEVIEVEEVAQHCPDSGDVSLNTQ